MHVRLSHYLLVLRGVLPGELLLQQAHRHLLDLCPACRKEWDGRPPFESASEIDLAANTEALVALRPPPERHFSLSHYDETLRRQSRLRAIARRAREDLSRLRRKPLETWPSVVRNATKRYRSRAFLLLLVEESRVRVRNAPHEAAALVALVPIALDRSPERAALPWARVLRMRAAAHHANALRVAGDLPAADRELAALRRSMQSHPLHSRDTEAEVSSLEASLRIGQRRFGEANRLLAAAAELASPQLASRIKVQHAFLLMSLGDAQRALEHYEQASAALEASAEPILHLAAVTGRVNCLCDLGRPREAGRLLAAEREALTAGGDGHLQALCRFYQARVDLGLRCLDRAVTGFTAARDQFLALDRDYDAVLTSLYLADTLLVADKITELRQLAADLVPLFRARGVERETLASLRLLAQAVQAETVTAALLSELRQNLATGSHGVGSLAAG